MLAARVEPKNGPERGGEAWIRICEVLRLRLFRPSRQVLVGLVMVDGCRRIQVDEAWASVYAKQKNVPTAKAAPANAGDIWTWVAIDTDTKLAASW
jgi:hypothetical protein